MALAAAEAGQAVMYDGCTCPWCDRDGMRYEDAWPWGPDDGYLVPCDHGASLPQEVAAPVNQTEAA